MLVDFGCFCLLAVVSWCLFRGAFFILRACGYGVFALLSVLPRFAYRRWLWYRLKSKLVQDRRVSEWNLTGDLSWDTEGPYISVLLASGKAKVRVDPSHVASLLLGRAESPSLESRIPSSLVLKNPLPAHTVQFLVGGEVVGSGFRTMLAGKSVLLTARHVLRTIRDSGSDAFISNGRVSFPFERSLKVILDAPKFDVVGLEFPSDLGSLMGVSTAKIGRTPSPGGTVRLAGQYLGEFVFTCGCVSGIGEGFRYKHTATTSAGFSGTPVLNNGRVVGIHLSGDVGFNWATSLDWLQVGLESELRDRGFTRSSEFDDSWSEAGWDFDGVATRTRHRGKAWCEDIREVPRDLYIGRTGVSWADLVDDDDEWAGFDDFGKTESAPPVGVSPSPEDPPLNGSAPGERAETQDTGSVHTENTTTPAPSETKEPSPTASSDAEGLTGTPSVGSDGKDASPRRKRKRSRRAKNGRGPQVAAKQSSPPSVSMPTATSTLAPPPVPLSTRPLTGWSTVKSTRKPRSPPVSVPAIPFRTARPWSVHKPIINLPESW